MVELACDSDGVCGVCRVLPPDFDVLRCDTCTCFWHMQCLRPPLTQVPHGDWECPDCDPRSGRVTAVVPEASGIVKRIREIEEDKALTEKEKADRRQAVLCNKPVLEGGKPSVSSLGDKYMCPCCHQDLLHPVSVPGCQHNFCLKCLKKWFANPQNASCPKCRAACTPKFRSSLRINFTVAHAIRMVRLGLEVPDTKTSGTPESSKKSKKHVPNKDRPDKAYASERAKRKGKANASSGKIFVTVPPDHFGPIPAEHDPVRNRGVLVGETWEDRLECRQWGTHRPHVSGIAGQGIGAQSVALSGGYEDDEDHGDWFLYTGSGGRDLSGNKRTTSEQSSNQSFETPNNKALVVSCKKGYPVRVVRSAKAKKKSNYAPAEGVRYDGVYRIEMCWLKPGIQKFQMCRYLFVRCDNEPAPWSIEASGDKPLKKLPEIPELKNVIKVKERKGSPAWDFNNITGKWEWMTPPPPSQHKECKPSGNKRRKALAKELATKFACGICKGVMESPLSAPCGHDYCKPCLEKHFAGHVAVMNRGSGRTLRKKKNIKRCPRCNHDIDDFMEKPVVNLELQELIQSLKDRILAEEKGKAKVEDDEEHDAEDEEEEEVEEEEEETEEVKEAEDEEEEEETEEVKEEENATPVPVVAEGGEKLIEDGTTTPVSVIGLEVFAKPDNSGSSKMENSGSKGDEATAVVGLIEEDKGEEVEMEVEMVNQDAPAGEVLELIVNEDARETEEEMGVNLSGRKRGRPSNRKRGVPLYDLDDEEQEAGRVVKRSYWLRNRAPASTSARKPEIIVLNDD